MAMSANRANASGVRILDASGNPVTSATPLPVQCWLNVSIAAADVQIGAVELKGDDSANRATISASGCLAVTVESFGTATFAISTITADDIDIRDLVAASDAVGIGTHTADTAPVNTILAQDVDIRDLAAASDAVGVGTYTADTAPVNTILAQDVDIRNLVAATDLVQVATFGGATMPITTITANTMPCNVVTITATGLMGITGTANLDTITADNRLGVTGTVDLNTITADTAPVNTILAQDVDIRNLAAATDLVQVATFGGSTFPITTFTNDTLPVSVMSFGGSTLPITTITADTIGVSIREVTSTVKMGITGTVSCLDAGPAWTEVGTFVAASGTSTIPVWTPTNKFHITDLMISVDTSTNVTVYNSHTAIYGCALGTNGGSNIIGLRTPIIGNTAASGLNVILSADSNVRIRVNGYDIA